MPTPHRPNFDPKWILIHQRPFSNERHLFGSLSFVTLMHQFVLCFVVRYLGNQVGFYMCTVWIGRLGRSPLHSSQQCLFFLLYFVILSLTTKHLLGQSPSSDRTFCHFSVRWTLRVPSLWLYKKGNGETLSGQVHPCVENLSLKYVGHHVCIYKHLHMCIYV